MWQKGHAESEHIYMWGQHILLIFVCAITETKKACECFVAVQLS